MLACASPEVISRRSGPSAENPQLEAAGDAAHYSPLKVAETLQHFERALSGASGPRVWRSARRERTMRRAFALQRGSDVSRRPKIFPEQLGNCWDIRK